MAGGRTELALVLAMIFISACGHKMGAPTQAKLEVLPTLKSPEVSRIEFHPAVGYMLPQPYSTEVVVQLDSSGQTGRADTVLFTNTSILKTCTLALAADQVQGLQNSMAKARLGPEVFLGMDCGRASLTVDFRSNVSANYLFPGCDVPATGPVIISSDLENLLSGLKIDCSP